MLDTRYENLKLKNRDQEKDYREVKTTGEIDKLS